MKTNEIEKSKTHNLIDLIEYVPNSEVSRTIMRKVTGYINIIAMDTGETLAEKISPFDTFIYIIEGVAELVIDDNSNVLKAGQAIIIPAHSSNVFFANQRFKMISSVIKSGYEGIIL
ncbi:MAG: cupin [Bacteroidetes bacterium GWC2_33_15]|nr:MAG: cupin [Bacteroidetes bacterium GWA2_33_15]OFX51576.1 MAG: cupin [Bacteroidetes bacterium GWC2_33_15]OFX63355.1 MAG: cupin [Bacteroidetes bacterium GWB2_32_14]OFX68046.1 MAG: cupin [Bacteroidetes bacterium GWD2_33_33]HAN17132.1 cupin [Bacteroidales bacterium]